MFSTLPDLIDPWRAADSGTVFAGRLPLRSLARLCGLLIRTSGDVDFRLDFHRDDGGRAVVTGEIRACLSLCCQRCLEEMNHEVAERVQLALVSGIDEAERLPDHYEPLLVEESLIRPRQLIEDELLLALPHIPKHASGGCVRQLDKGLNPEPGAHGDEANPFAVLAAIKRNHKR